MLLNENVSVPSISDAIKGRYEVTINYEGDPKHGIAPGIRTIQVYIYGLTKIGNPCIRAYQPYGDTVSDVPEWKLFRIDRILSWKPTFSIFSKPAPKYNPNGDKSMSSVLQKIDFTTPANQTNVDGPRQTPKVLGTLPNIDKILADREKEKQTKKDLEKQANTSKPIEPKQISNKNIPEPIIGDEKPKEEPEVYKTKGDEELEKFKDLSKRIENAPILDKSLLRRK
jgi:hypothetical protein